MDRFFGLIIESVLFLFQNLCAPLFGFFSNSNWNGFAKLIERETSSNTLISFIENNRILIFISDFMINRYDNFIPFYKKNQILFWLGGILLLYLTLLIIAISNYVKRKKIEKNISKEFGKIDLRVKQKTGKLNLTNEHLQLEMSRLNDTIKHLRQLNKAIETMHLGVVITDLADKIIYINRAHAQMHGYDPDELLGKFSSVFTSNVLRDEIDLDKIVEWKGKMSRSSNIKKDGSIFDVQLISDIVFNDDNEPIAIVTTCEDISERSKSEKQLKNSEENFRRIFDNIQDVYYEIDIDGIIREISPSVINITDINRESLIGKPMDMLYANTKQRNNLLRALKKEETVTDYEILIKNEKLKKQIQCSVTAKLMLDDSGLPMKIIGSMRNITARKNAELEQARVLKTLQQANKELRDFAYVTSHDLKSPLRAINTLANWLSLDYADKFDDKAKEQMNLLLSRVDRMHNLIEAIFQYSSLGNFQGKKEKVLLHELVYNEIKKLNAPESIKISIVSKLPEISYEKNRISQVFQHLLSNAIQFMTKDEGAVTIDFKNMPDQWIFSVADTGPGIENKYFTQIFEMFKTLQSRDEYESSGIGLTIVKKIIEMNGGKIWLESTVGVGTTFFFSILKNPPNNTDSED